MQDRVLGETVGDFYNGEKSVQREFILSESDKLWWEVECGRWLGGAGTGWLGQNWFKIVFYVIQRTNCFKTSIKEDEIDELYWFKTKLD